MNSFADYNRPNDKLKILIIRLSSIGDIILTTPLIRCVRNHYPSAEITFLAKKEYCDLLKTNPHLNHVMTYDKLSGTGGLKKIKKNIRLQKFDILIDIHKNLRSTYLRIGSAARIKTRYRKQIAKRTLLVLFKINLFKNIKPIYLRYFEAVSRFGINYDDLGTEVFVPDKETAKIKELLKKGGFDSVSPIMTICPGASFSNKRWKFEKFIELSSYFQNSRNFFICILGGVNDVDTCSEIRRKLDRGSINFAGKLSLLESAALLNQSTIVVTNDSGMMHLAQSQKKPVVSIYGPTTNELGYFPLKNNAEVVEYDIACRPCTHNGLNHCPKKHFKCMEKISTNQVISSINRLIVN